MLNTIELVILLGVLIYTAFYMYADFRNPSISNKLFQSIVIIICILILVRDQRYKSSLVYSIERNSCYLAETNNSDNYYYQFSDNLKEENKYCVWQEETLFNSIKCTYSKQSCQIEMQDDYLPNIDFKSRGVNEFCVDSVFYDFATDNYTVSYTTDKNGHLQYSENTAKGLSYDVIQWIRNDIDPYLPPTKYFCMEK